MNSVELLIAMGDAGYLFKRREIIKMMEYFDLMLRDNRVVMITNDNRFRAMIAFSMCHDYDPYFKKESWEYLPQDPTGDIIYIEKMVSIGWNKEIRTLFEEVITKVYPEIRYAIWHRWAKFGDRKVVYKRRLNHVRNKSIE